MMDFLHIQRSPTIHLDNSSGVTTVSKQNTRGRDCSKYDSGAHTKVWDGRASATFTAYDQLCAHYLQLAQMGFGLLSNLKEVVF